MKKLILSSAVMGVVVIGCAKIERGMEMKKDNGDYLNKGNKEIREGEEQKKYPKEKLLHLRKDTGKISKRNLDAVERHEKWMMEAQKYEKK